MHFSSFTLLISALFLIYTFFYHLNNLNHVVFLSNVQRLYDVQPRRLGHAKSGKRSSIGHGASNEFTDLSIFSRKDLRSRQAINRQAIYLNLSQQVLVYSANTLKGISMLIDFELQHLGQHTYILYNNRAYIHA